MIGFMFGEFMSTFLELRHSHLQIKASGFFFHCEIFCTWIWEIFGSPFRSLSFKAPFRLPHEYLVRCRSDDLFQERSNELSLSPLSHEHEPVGRAA